MLESFLNTKPLFYDLIDYTRMPRIYESIKHRLHTPPTIHIVGTNGKGTTGRFLANALLAQGHSVGHYTSPHIVMFNERIWLNGEDIEDTQLEISHQALLSLLSTQDAEALSYFEYTTLLAMFIFQNVDYVVLEAGLGGEYDATAVFENILTLITPISFDHEAFLGDDIESIATTKLRAVQKKGILGVQKFQEVYSVAKELAIAKNISLRPFQELLDAGDIEKIKKITSEHTLAPHLQENLSLAIAALKSLGREYKIDDFHQSTLFGRLSPLGNNILLDVGHNVLAAEAICYALEGTKRVLIYNSFKDKDYEKILTLLKPVVEYVEIIPIEDTRAESYKKLTNSLEKLAIEYKNFDKIDGKKQYLVFGSFSVAEAFLKVYNE